MIKAIPPDTQVNKLINVSTKYIYYVCTYMFTCVFNCLFLFVNKFLDMSAIYMYIYVFRWVFTLGCTYIFKYAYLDGDFCLSINS